MKLPTMSSLSAALFGISKKHCEVHENIAETLEKVAIQQATNVEQIKNHKELLDSGTQDFKDIKKHMASIDTSIAVLAEKAKQRRNAYKKEDDEEAPSI